MKRNAVLLMAWNELSLFRLLRSQFRNWPSLYLRHLVASIVHTNPVCMLPDGVKFKIHPLHRSREDIRTIRVIYTNRLWNPPGYEIQHGDVVVDVGAHIGCFSILAAMWMPKVQVFSYEPAPSNFKLLVYNIRLNNLENIEAFPFAVTTNERGCRLFLSQQSDAHTTIQPDNYSDSVEVNTITLEEIIAKIGKCDFLKINCEGAEYEILFNTPEEYLAKVGKLAIDCHPNKTRSAHDLHKYLTALNFKVKSVDMNSNGSHCHLYAKNNRDI